MIVLVTGSAGFLGRNLVENLQNIQDGKNRTRPALNITKVLTWDRSGTQEELREYCARADFVFHLAGVNRPQDPAEFTTGNVELTARLIEALEAAGSRAPVLFASSIQAALTGRFEGSAYGRSKRAAEALLLDYSGRSGGVVYIYRFPNLVGKWIRPDYNSAVATFCYRIARDLPIEIRDPETELELLFVEDLLEEFYDAMEGRPHREENSYCHCPVTHRAKLGEIAALLRSFHAQQGTLEMPPQPEGSLEKKLFSMYLSYLPPEKAVQPLVRHSDERGSFTEVMKLADCGQISVNVLAPGKIKGQHWHNAKWEIFVVVSGHGCIEQRRIGTEEVIRYELDGSEPKAVYALPGYAHNIINLSDTQEMVVLIWANEGMDPARPDTYREVVDPEDPKAQGRG